MIIASRKMVYQINDNEFETVTDSKTFNDTDTIVDIKKWYDEQNKSFHFYASPAIQILFMED